MTYRAPGIEAGAGAARLLKDLPGRCLAVSMPLPWEVLQKQQEWTPGHVHMVEDMEEETLERLNGALPECDVVVGVGGGSCCDTAKYLAWKRGCRMVLVPTIMSVDAPFTNMVAVRVDRAVQYVGDIYPEEIVIDYDVIQQAPKVLNRAGAADIASIHTALYDWDWAHREAGEAYDGAVAALARGCLVNLDRNAGEVFEVTPKGIDTIANLYCQEVAFCARLGTSRPEEGSEHLVAYNIEHMTGRHFVHGDLVALGIFLMTRLQGNEHAYAVDLMDRLGLRYRMGDVSGEEVRGCLETLRKFKEEQGLFFSVVDSVPVTPGFVEEALGALYGG